MSTPAPTRLQQLDYTVLQQCMHCGMCLPSCPTYVATGREGSSPRGRIALMRAIANSELTVSRAFGEEMDFCLGCLACQTACPAGVTYAELFETARAEAEDGHCLDSRSRRFYRALTLRGFFRRPRLLRWLARVIRWWQRSGLESWARQRGLLRLLPARLRELEPLTPRIADAFSDQLIRPVERPANRRFRVAVLTGCVQDVIFPGINRDTVDVLLANGCEVVTPPVQSCCGSLHAHNGDLATAREMARRQIDLFPPDDFDAVITNAAGCGSHLKHLDRCLAGDVAYAERAKRWTAKVRDISEWLIDIGIRPPEAGEETAVVYHDACHLCHGQGITEQPRALLRAIPGLRLVPLAESTWCCGSAGVYSITQPAMAGQLLRRKVAHIRAAGGAVVAAANPGCILQLQNGLRAAGIALPVVHPVSLLAAAYRRGHSSASTAENRGN